MTRVPFEELPQIGQIALLLFGAPLLRRHGPDLFLGEGAAPDEIRAVRDRALQIQIEQRFDGASTRQMKIRSGDSPRPAARIAS